MSDNQGVAVLEKCERCERGSLVLADDWKCPVHRAPLPHHERLADRKEIDQLTERLTVECCVSAALSADVTRLQAAQVAESEIVARLREDVATAVRERDELRTATVLGMDANHEHVGRLKAEIERQFDRANRLEAERAAISQIRDKYESMCVERSNEIEGLRRDLSATKASVEMARAECDAERALALYWKEMFAQRLASAGEHDRIKLTATEPIVLSAGPLRRCSCGHMGLKTDNFCAGCARPTTVKERE